MKRVKASKNVGAPADIDAVIFTLNAFGLVREFEIMCCVLGKWAGRDFLMF